MKRKTSSIPSAIWSFGAKEPTRGLDLLRDQLGGAHWLWNALTRIELRRRDEIKAAEAALTEETVQAARDLKTAERKASKNASAEEREKSRETLKAALSALPGYDTIDAINVKANEHGKDALHGARLHFGTYLLVLKAIEAAKKTPEGPNVKKWLSHSGVMRGGRQEMAEGRVGAHIMKGCTAEELRAGTMLQVEIPTIEWDTATRGERRRGARTVARIRAGSDGRKPIWVEFPVTLHRPFPTDARIKAAWLSCRYVGTQWKYEFQVQIESRTFAAVKPVGHGTVAIDLCWRRRDEGIRVAYACDAAGARREILMPEDVLLDVNAGYKIKGHADTVFDETRDALDDALGSLALPEHFARKFEALRMWKSAQRFHAAVIWWHDNRFVGDAEAFDLAWAGLQRWRHLYQYTTGVQQRALGRRKKYYEDIALQICERYAKIIVGDFDMRDCVELDKAAADAPKGARHNRVVASPSEFRNVLKATARRLGAEVEIEDCADATRECSACGHVHELDPFVVDFRCEGCGLPWDRGHNHCTNLLKRSSGSVPPKSQVPLDPMFPRVLATPPGERKIRMRRRSKTVVEVSKSTEEISGAVENLAQEV